MIIIFGGEFGEKRTNAKTVKTRERTNSTKKMTETKVTVINSGRLDLSKENGIKQTNKMV